MKIAKLIIKGLREPIELTEEQGRKAQKIKNAEGEYATLPDDTTIDIGGKWTGERRDIRYIILESARDPYASGENQYSKEELEEFQIELEPYFMEYEDKEFNSIVEHYIDLVVDKKSKIILTAFTKERLLTIRKTYVDDLTKDNEDIKKEIQKLVKERRVGKLSKAGEYRFLRDKNAITLDEKDELKAVFAKEYTELSSKLSQYQDMVSISEFVSDKQAQDVQKAYGDVTSDMAM